MHPAELAPRMPAAVRQLAAPGPLAGPDLDDRADRIDVRRRLSDAQGEPVGTVGVAARHGSGVPPESDRRAVRGLDQVEPAVDVEVDERGPAGAVKADDPRDVGDLHERAFGLAEQEVAGVLHGEVGLARWCCPSRRTGR